MTVPETTYLAAVAEARTLVKRSEADQWRLAQLTWENVPEVGFDRWAQDIGKHESYVRRLSAMWSSHRQDEVLPPFTEAYKEVSPSSAYKPELRNQPVADQAAAVQEALANPEVAAKVFSDPETKTKALTAIHGQHEDSPRPAPQRPIPTRQDVLGHLAGAREEFRQAFKLGLSLRLAGDDDVLAHLDDALDEGEKFHVYLVGMGLDETISAIMEGT